MLLAREIDTITAIATPTGEGGIAVIRISGEKAVAIADRGFRGLHPLDKMSSHTAHYGRFVDENEVTVDSIVATVFRSPHSYTGEDTVELSCHGGRLMAKTVLETTIRFGARAALPGEFTKRAFLNGRMDLAQAEAVADLIHARSTRAQQASLGQLSGRLSERINSIRAMLIESIGLLELELDFAEDGYEFADKGKVKNQIKAVNEEIDALMSSYRLGKVYRDGVKVALAGAPNVGKSSLLNALLQEDRAIVTDIPGTTRDVIEESITLGGLVFDLSDTAGIRRTNDPIEQEGVRRAEQRLSDCDILVLLLDQSRDLVDEEADAIRRLVSSVEARGATCIFALNKVDIPGRRAGSLSGIMDLFARHSAQEISAKTHQGLDGLKGKMVEAALRGGTTSAESGITITNARHHSALGRTKMALNLALESLEAEKSSEFVAIDLRSGLDALGEIVGITSTDDILDAIFSRFCIGK